MQGKVIRIIGPVLDMRFPKEHMPDLHSLVYVEDGERRVATEVTQHLDGGVVRCLALEATEGLRRGLDATDTGGPVMAPVGMEMLGRAIDVLGRPIDGKAPLDSAQRMPIHRKPPSFLQQRPVTQVFVSVI